MVCFDGNVSDFWSGEFSDVFSDFCRSDKFSDVISDFCGSDKFSDVFSDESEEFFDDGLGWIIDSRGAVGAWNEVEWRVDPSGVVEAVKDDRGIVDSPGAVDT